MTTRRRIRIAIPSFASTAHAAPAPDAATCPRTRASQTRAVARPLRSRSCGSWSSAAVHPGWARPARGCSPSRATASRSSTSRREPGEWSFPLDVRDSAACDRGARGGRRAARSGRRARQRRGRDRARRGDRDERRGVARAVRRQRRRHVLPEPRGGARDARERRRRDRQLRLDLGRLVGGRGTRRLLRRQGRRRTTHARDGARPRARGHPRQRRRPGRGRHADAARRRPRGAARPTPTWPRWPSATIPMGRVATPDEIARVVVFLASPRRQLHDGGDRAASTRAITAA